MKRMKKALFYFLIAVGLVLFFLPKTQLYYGLEGMLKPYNVFISGEVVHDYGWNMVLKEGTLAYDDLNVATFDAVSVTPLLIYNAVTVDPVLLAEDMDQFLPRSIETIRIVHSIFNPLHVSIVAEGEFGTLEGDVALLDRNVSLLLNPSKALMDRKPFWLGRLKKDSEGGYRYETAY